MRKFLTAKWIDLIMANYVVDPKLLTDRLPYGTEIDLDDGRCFLSLVGFMFLDTRVMGLPIPFHVNFEEINLRFYVRRETENELRQGVVFVKEIVQRFAVTAVARAVYGEPYECWLMTNERDSGRIAYSWKRRGCENHMAVDRGQNRGIPESGSHDDFIIEHYWGYTRRKNHRTDEYKVEHPKWESFEAVDPIIAVDFGKTYGDEFAFLSGEKPYSVLLSNGSEVAVYKGEKIT